MYFDINITYIKCFAIWGGAWPSKEAALPWVQLYILVDKQPAKRFVEDADCRKIYRAVAALSSLSTEQKYTFDGTLYIAK